MKPILFYIVISLASFNTSASVQFDYSNKIGDAYMSEKSPTDIIIEAVNIGVFKANDYIRNNDDSGTAGSLGSILASTYEYITDDNFLNTNKENARGLEFLLSKGLDPNQVDKDHGFKLIISAASSCNLDAIKSLINHGAEAKIYFPSVFYPTSTTLVRTTASAVIGSKFNYITQDLPIELDSCLNTYKYLVEVVGIDVKKYCGGTVGDTTNDRSVARYITYLKDRYGENYAEDCTRRYNEEMKQIKH